jgi:hypothetical protein
LSDHLTVEEVMRVSGDKLIATVEIHGEYRAGEMERLIEELSAMRARMLPEVPLSPGAEGREGDPGAARAAGDPCVQVAVMRDGMTRFFVRHAGIGWFGFNLPVERARTLAQHILGLALPRGEARKFFGRKRRESDPFH